MDEYQVEGAKAKLAWPMLRRPTRLAWLWPPYWMTSLVLWPWQGLDDDLTTMDFNVQLKVDAIAKSSGKEAKVHELVSLGTVDFPFEGVLLSERGSQPTALDPLASPYLPLPEGINSLYVNLTATVVEDNDLGDVIAERASKAKEKQGDPKSKIQDFLGGE